MCRFNVVDTNSHLSVCLSVCHTRNEEFEARVKDIDRNDYLALTTLYIQVFNPARASIAEKYLSKYKGREAEMFAELSSKWLAINPLEKSKEEQPNKPQNLFASTPSQPTTTTSASSPFAAPFKTEEKKSDTTSPFAAPFTSKPTLNNIASKPAADAAPSKDYHKLLTEFYQKHNSQKLPEVAKTLEKYKVRKMRIQNMGSVLKELTLILYSPLLTGKRSGNVHEVSNEVQNV